MLKYYDKVTLVVTALILGNLSFINAQDMSNSVSGYVQYSYYIDSLSAKNKMATYKKDHPEKYAAMGDQLEMLWDYSRKLRFTLEVNEEACLFSPEEEVQIDSPMEQLVYKTAIIAAMHAKEAYLIDYGDKSSSFIMDWMGTKIQVIEPLETPNWAITGERKFSNGRTLIEATASVQLPIHKEGKKTLVRAFYDPSIPLPYGPGGYHGLPGLILELYIETEEPKGFIASNIHLNGGTNTEIKVPRVVAKMTKEEFDRKVMGEAQNK